MFFCSVTGSDEARRETVKRMEHNEKKYFSALPAVSPYITQKQFRRNQSVQRTERCAYFPFPKGNRSVCGEKFPAIFASLFRFPQTGNLVFGIGKEMKLLFRFNAVATALLLFMLREKGGGGGRTNSCFPKIANPKFPLKFACLLLLLFPFSHSRPN